MAVIKAVTKQSILIVGFSDGRYSSYKLGKTHPVWARISSHQGLPGVKNLLQMGGLDKPYWAQQLLLPLNPLWNRCSCFYNYTLTKTIKSPSGMTGIHSNPVGECARCIPNQQISIIPKRFAIIPFWENPFNADTRYMPLRSESLEPLPCTLPL